MTIESKVLTAIRYLRQPSTWQGIVGAAALLGYNLDPEQIKVIITVAGTALSILQVLKDDDKLKTLTKDQWIEQGVKLGLLKRKTK